MAVADNPESIIGHLSEVPANPDDLARLLDEIAHLGWYRDMLEAGAASNEISARLAEIEAAVDGVAGRPETGFDAEPTRFPRVPDNSDTAVTVLIPLFNYQQYVAQCIESVLSQSYPNIELLVVDNASTDDSYGEALRACGSDSRASVLRSPTHLSVNDSFRYCYGMATGSLVRFLCADDYFESPTSLDALVGALQCDPNNALVVSKRHLVSADGSDSGSDTGTHDSDMTVNGETYGNLLLTTHGIPFGHMILFKRDLLPMELYDSIGGYHPGAFLDLAWTLNILRSGNLCYVNEDLDAIRIHEGQETNSVTHSPRWLTERLKLVKGGREIGYLSDAAAEYQSLKGLLGKFKTLPAFDHMMTIAALLKGAVST